MQRADAATIYSALTTAGATPAGLFAQTSMRVEKGFCAMGHELDSDTTPVEAGMETMFRKEVEFIGKTALDSHRSKGATTQVVTLVLDDEDAMPLGHEPIYLNGKIIGHVTTAAFGYRIGKPVALGYVDIADPDGVAIDLDIARVMFSGRLTKGPAFDPTGARMRNATGG